MQRDCPAQASCWRLLEYASLSAPRFAEVVRLALPHLVLPFGGRASTGSCSAAFKACARSRASLEVAEEAVVPTLSL